MTPAMLNGLRAIAANGVGYRLPQTATRRALYARGLTTQEHAWMPEHLTDAGRAALAASPNRPAGV